MDAMEGDSDDEGKWRTDVCVNQMRVVSIHNQQAGEVP